MEDYRIILENILCELEPYEEIKNDTELIESGILNSLSIVFLITQLENDYNIIIDESKITPENFKNINSIANLINEQLSFR